MEVYEELVNRLRKAHERQLWLTTPDDTVRTLFSDAADTIEELIKRLEEARHGA